MRQGALGLQKLKLALVLPVIQVVVAVIILHSVGPPDFYESKARMICWGLNAPALLFRVMALWGPISEFVPGAIFGIDSSDVLFLVGVTIVWYLVGRALDQRRFSRTAARPGTATAVIVYCLLLTVEGFLFCAGLNDFQYVSFADLDRRFWRDVLTLAWAVSLIFISGRRLVTAIRHSRQQ